MAKKTKKTEKPTALTPGQYKQLARTLGGTRWNVYTLAETTFGIKVGEEVFDGLKQHASLCKCEMCDEWKDKSEMSKDVTGDVCEECMGGDDMDDE